MKKKINEANVTHAFANKNVIKWEFWEFIQYLFIVNMPPQLLHTNENMKENVLVQNTNAFLSSH